MIALAACAEAVAAFLATLSDPDLARAVLYLSGQAFPAGALTAEVQV